MSMPQTPEPAATEPEEADEGTYVPEPPRRVPFATALVTVLLGVIGALLLVLAVSAVVAFNGDENLARSAGAGVLILALFLAGTAVGTVAWSFVRNGNQIAALVIGGLVALVGLIFFVQGLLSDFYTEDVAYGLTALFLGLAVALVPLIGDSPAYLAARRSWAKAEHEWLSELVAAGKPVPPPWPGPNPYQPHPQQPYAYQQPWPQQPQQQWTQPQPQQQWPQQPWPQQQPPVQPQPQPPVQQPQPQQPYAPSTEQFQAWPPPAGQQPGQGAPAPADQQGPDQPASGPPRQ